MVHAFTQYALRKREMCKKKKNICGPRICTYFSSIRRPFKQDLKNSAFIESTENF